MAIRLIALDIDGTLLDSRWKLPEANRITIAEATRRGIEVALVTGRRYDFALPIARQIAAPLTMIVSNGAIIRTNDGETRLRHLLARETARRVLELMGDWRDSCAVIFDRPGKLQIMLERRNSGDPILEAYYSRNQEFIGLANPLETCLTEDPIQVMFSGANEAMREAERALRGAPFASEYSVAATVYESRNFSMIDVVNPVCSKGASLREWVRLRGIAREEVLAIGDNHNDLEMLAFAGVPVVMGNAVGELKSFGWRETGSNDEGGVAAAIERYALRELGEAAPCA
jgi:Cof subfamily protein (haloacid dehalogenase superfamily)